jgi:mannosyltransferase
VLPAGLRRAVLRVVLFAVPAAAATGVGLWAFTAVPLSNDEAVTVEIAGRTVPQILRTMTNVDAVHGVYYLFMHFIVAGFGVGESTMRIPSLVGTAVAAGLLALLGEMLRSWRVGLIAGVLFACAPAASQYAQDARPYGVVFALVVAMTMALVSALTGRHRTTMWILYALALLTSVALHLFVVLILPAYAVTVGLFARRDRTWRPVIWWLCASVLALAPLIGLIRLIVSQKGTAGWIRPPGWPALLDLLVLLAGGTFLLAAAAMLIGFAYGQTGDRSLTVFAVAAPWLLIPPLLLLVGSRFEPLYAFRYVAYCVPALALLAGAGLDRLRWWLLVPVTAALIAATLPAQNAVRFHPDGVSGVNDLRAVSRLLQARQSPGDGIIYVAPGQRYLAAAYPRAYRSLQDVTLDQTPTAAATVTGTDVDTATVIARLARLNRVWTVKYFVWSSGAAAYRRSQAHMFAALHTAGFRWQYTVRERGAAIALWVRRGA